MLYQFPIRIIPWLNPPVTGLVKESREADWEATVAATNILVSRPSWLTKICAILERLDNETPQNIQLCVLYMISSIPSPNDGQVNSHACTWTGMGNLPK